MNRFRKWIIAAASAALFLTGTGCEMSQAAGTDSNPPELNLSPEEQQELEQFVKDTFGVDMNSNTPAEGTAAATETAAPEVTPDPKAELEKLEKAVLENPDFALSDNGHGSRSLQDMIDAWRPVNSAAADPFIEALSQYSSEPAATPEGQEAVLQLYHTIIETVDQEEVMEIVSSLQFNRNVLDKDASEKKNADDNAYDELTFKCKAAIRDALKGTYGEALKAEISPLQVDAYLNASDYTDKIRELSEEYNKISSDYRSLMEEPLSIEFEGKTYTTEDILPETLDKTARSKIKDLLQLARSEQIYPYYIQLVKNRNAYAQELGYADFIEYAYKVQYGRDYTADDVLALAKTIGSDSLPLMAVTLACQAGSSLSAIPLKLSNDELVKLFSENITKVSPELAEALDYMKKYGLYDFGDEESRSEGAYLSPINALRSGYIFIHRSNTADDYESLTHEFGHFNNAYHTYSPGLGRTQHLEVLETHSQGLEMLGSTTLKDVFPDQKGDFTAEVTLARVQATTSAIMVAAFEIECFRNPDMTLEDMNATMARYAALAMLGVEVPQDEEGNESMSSPIWPNIHHLFICPLYYSSYAFSSLSALDIYSQYLQDPDTAVKNYLTLVHVDPDEKYVKAMTSAGLRDMTKQENIKNVMDTLTQHYQQELAERITESLQDGTIGEMLISTIGGFVGGLVR